MGNPFIRAAATAVIASAAGLACAASHAPAHKQVPKHQKLQKQAEVASAAQEQPRDYRLGPGDSIKVQVYQSPDLSLEARVSESGIINYPLVGRIDIGGLTVPDALRRR
jgi:polysaccharide biosynthesis/export protein